MSIIRPPAVAGSFYPQNPEQLRLQVEQFLANACSEKIDTLKALIVPHAGYLFSGSTAAEAYVLLNHLKKQFNRVVILGPAHRVWLKGMAIPQSDWFATPLGNIELDKVALNKLGKHPQVNYSDQAHQFEHSIEVQLPFIQQTLEKIKLIPIVVGDLETSEVLKAIESFWKDPNTLLIISTDLSHFKNDADARKIDCETSRLIEQYDYQSINPEMACGSTPLKGLLKLAKITSKRIKRLKLTNSGNTNNDKDRVVGYGAYAIY